MEQNSRPKHWSIVKFTDIFDIIGGSQPSKDLFVFSPQTGYVRLLQIRDFGASPEPVFVPINSVSKFCTKSDILIARYGASIGKILTGMEGAYNVAMAKVEIPGAINTRFAYYYFTSDWFQSQITGFERSAQAGFNKEDLSNISFPLPPPKEQAAIVAQLDAFFDGAKSRAVVLKKIENAIGYLRQSALQKGVSGELTEEWRRENGAATNVQKKLPQNWTLSTINAVYSINPPILQNIEDNTTVSFIPMAAVEAETGIIDLSQIKKYGEVKKGYTKFQEGDLLYAKITPSMQNGKYAIARKLENGIGCGTTEFHIFREKDLGLNEFLRFFLLQTEIRHLAEDNFEGSTGFQRVPASFFKKKIFPLPPLPEQHEIVHRVQYYLAVADKLQASYESIKKSLDDLQKSILHKAFQGELSTALPDGEPIKDLLERIAIERIALETNRNDERKNRQKMKKAQPKEINIQTDLPALLRETFDYQRFNNESLVNFRVKIATNTSKSIVDFERFADTFGELISTPLEEGVEPYVNTHYENGELFYTNNLNRAL
ncbi:MAG: hypothetical protein RI894_2560 [Bacteroidota bacterium]|jgi:type I restriction enzyme S subunit